VIEVTTLGGDVIRDTSLPIHIGFLENTPFGTAPGLLAFWPLAEDFEDYTINQNHMTPIGVPIHQTIPNTSFQGTYFSNDAYLTSPHNNQLNPARVSISALLYLDDLNDPADLYTLVSKREYSGWGNSFDFKVSKRDPSGFKVSVSWTHNGTDTYLESTQNFPFKQKTHIFYVHDENKIKIIEYLLNHVNPNAKIIIGDIGFQNQDLFIENKNRLAKEWDESEYYFDLESFKKSLESKNLKFKSKTISEFCIYIEIWK
jgi:hypothetical protein